jgi:Protein of unknown function (DUF2934)
VRLQGLADYAYQANETHGYIGAIAPSAHTHTFRGSFMPVDHQAIAERAYQLWESRGRPEGEHEQIWIDAERELQQAGSKVAEATAPTPSEPLATVKPRRR